MKLLLVVGYDTRSHRCSRCGRRSDYRADLFTSPPDRWVHVCIACYEALVTNAPIDPCAGGSCDT